VPIVVVERYQSGVVDDVVDAERAGAVVTDGRVVANRLIEFVVVAGLVFEFGNPLRASAVEDEFDVVALDFGELLGRFEPVRETALIGV
jgi:hypothetical protein